MGEPKTLTEAIDRLKAALAPLDWTDAIFGRAAVQEHSGPGQEKQLLPMVHVGGGDYHDCRPDDDHKSVVFFYAKEGERNDFSREKGHAPNHIIRPRRALTLIGWANLSKLPGWDDDSGFPELIKRDLKNKLKRVSCVATIGDFQDGSLNEVYRPFVVSQTDRKYDRWPFVVFRLELTVYTIETNA